MADRDETFTQLLAKWQNMPAGDRKAVERALSVEQRLALDEALALGEDEDANTAANEYRGYSPWLGKLLKAAASGDTSGNLTSAVKPKTREALCDIHGELSGESGTSQAATGILARAKQAWHDFGALR